MSAARLREAAKVLRNRATGVLNEDGWSVVLAEKSLAVTGICTGRFGHIDIIKGRMDLSTADYITTMHPGVGLALADWLDLIATSWTDPHVDDHTDFDGWHIEFEESTDSHGLRIADLILGGEQS